MPILRELLSTIGITGEPASRQPREIFADIEQNLGPEALRFARNFVSYTSAARGNSAILISVFTDAIENDDMGFNFEGQLIYSNLRGELVKLTPSKNDPMSRRLVELGRSFHPELRISSRKYYKMLSDIGYGVLRELIEREENYSSR